MSRSVFNKTKGLDFTKQPMFFGEDLQVQQYSDMKYPIFDKLNQQALGYFWRPEEVSLQKDRNDYPALTPEQKFIFTSNLKYQTMLDSVQGRGPCLAFLPFVSIPELEGCIITWDFFETIHSRSYTYIIKNLYSNPNEVFDTIVTDEKIEKRSKSVTKTYDDLIDLGHKWHVNPDKVDMYELKKKMYPLMRKEHNQEKYDELRLEYDEVLRLYETHSNNDFRAVYIQAKLEMPENYTVTGADWWKAKFYIYKGLIINFSSYLLVIGIIGWVICWLWFGTPPVSI